MQTLRSKASRVFRHPAWAAGEIVARSRLHLAPRRGRRLGTVGPLRFPFDFELDPAVRRMYARAYETEIVGLFRRLLRPGDIFVDVGANIGYLSAVAAGQVTPSGRVSSYEPAPRYFSRLEEVQQLNPSYRWDVRQCGLGARPGVADLALARTNIGWNSLVPEHVPSELLDCMVTVPIVRLDDCLREAKIERVRLLKIDVEGYEGPVILGARSYLRERRIDHLVVEVQPGKYRDLGLDFAEVMTFLRDCGYQGYQTRRPYRHAGSDDLVHCADIWFRSEPQQSKQRISDR
jgi:FkbM family methyltransferase